MFKIPSLWISRTKAVWHVILHLPWSVLVLSWKAWCLCQNNTLDQKHQTSCVMTGSWDKTLKVCCIVEGLPGLTKWTLFLHYLDVSSEWLVTCLFFFFFGPSVLGYTIIKSHDGVTAPWKVLLCWRGKEFFTLWYLIIRGQHLEGQHLEDNVKPLQTLIIDVDAVWIASVVVNLDFCTACVPELQKTGCHTFLVT